MAAGPSPVPGKLTIRVQPFADGDPGYKIIMGSGKTAPGGYTIAEWRKRLGGDEGYIRGPGNTGRTLLSLTPYTALDPNKTRLFIAYSFAPDASTPQGRVYAQTMAASHAARQKAPVMASTKNTGQKALDFLRSRPH